MAPRIARSSLQSSAPKGQRKKNKAAKRSLNAFAIAEASAPETHKIRRSRLGQVEDDEPRNKRRRLSDDEDEDSEEEERPRRKARVDDDEESEASDGEGNRWKVGVVDEDDDSDIDSDEAFGESDEEKYEGWTFRGGSGDKKLSKPKKKVEIDEDGGMNLDEEASEEEDDDESLGSDAVDLATMLDNYEASEDEDEGSGDEGSSESENAPPSDYSMSDDDGEDLDRAARLQTLVSSLQPKEKAAKKAREPDFHESKAPSAAGIVSSEKFDINDFLATTSDSQLKKVSKELGALPKAHKKELKLQPSLPKRQKDKLERIAANEKAKETLGRWVDTVKQQRQAEHLSYPLVDPDAAIPEGSKQLISTAQSKPFNDLEAAIANIMQESGLGSGRRDEEEEKLREFEELKANKMPIEEVEARRAELRKARDLMFREEIRAKRISKIKSKAYRRIKRKEKEKLAALDRDAFEEGMDGEMDEEEREMAERRRAESRMSLKHKDSKWAKQMKKSGRTAWDDDAISGVSEMAKKNDELRRRIEGKEIRDEDASGDDALSSSDDEGSADEDDDAAEFQQLQRQLNRAFGDDGMDEKASKLYGLKFMREAEERKKKENQDLINQMRRELNGKVDESEEEVEQTIGRKIFAPNMHAKVAEVTKQERGEFEELDEDGKDDDVEVTINEDVQPRLNGKKASDGEKSKPSQPKGILKTTPAVNESSTKSMPKSTSTKEKSSLDSNVEMLPGEQHSQPDADGWTTVTYGQDEDDEVDEAAETGILDQAEILRRAFAGDDVEEAFEDEKHATMADEDDKIVDETLPGWGSWVGDGLSRKDKKAGKRRHANQLKKVEGIRPDKRKDAKLKGVIINQKRNKKTSAYLAKELPHVFGSKTEYERSIRMPVGKEWNTGAIYHENVKPRVMVKQGSVVKPMEKPLL